MGDENLALRDSFGAPNKVRNGSMDGGLPSAAVGFVLTRRLGHLWSFRSELGRLMGPH